MPPSEDQVEDALLACRYGDQDSVTEIKEFIKDFGASSLLIVKDESDNTALHMAAANGHVDIVELLIKALPVESLTAVNASGNTPLHWAALNAQLQVLRLLAPHLSPDQILLKNAMGKTAIDIAEERASETSLECAGYLEGQLPETEEEKKGEERAMTNNKESSSIVNGVARMDVQDDVESETEK